VPPDPDQATAGNDIRPGYHLTQWISANSTTPPLAGSASASESRHKTMGWDHLDRAPWPDQIAFPQAYSAFLQNTLCPDSCVPANLPGRGWRQFPVQYALPR